MVCFRLFFGQALLKAIYTVLPIPLPTRLQCLTAEGESITQASFFLKTYDLLFQLLLAAPLLPLLSAKHGHFVGHGTLAILFSLNSSCLPFSCPFQRDGRQRATV